MRSRTLGVLLAGGLVATTALLASPVAASLGRNNEVDSIRIGWSSTSDQDDDVDQAWWAVRSHETADNFVERLLSIPVGMLARRVGAGFEAKLSEGTGL